MFFAVIFILAAFLVSDKIADAEKEYARAIDANIAVSDLNMVFFNYLAQREKRMEEQWRLRYNSAIIVPIATPGAKATEEEKKLAELIRNDYVLVGSLFSQVTENYEKRQRLIQAEAMQEEIDVIIATEEKLTAQLLIKLQSVTTSASRIARLAIIELTLQNEKAKNLILFLVIIFIIGLGATTLIIPRVISKSIDRLNEEAKIMSKGDFSYRIKLKTKDEIGELSAVFNKLACEITSILSNLEQRVEDRTEELNQKKKNLEDQQIAILNILEDVEDEKENVSKGKEKIDAILYNIGDGVFAINSESKIFMFNRAASEISGFDQKNILDKEYNKILKFVFEKDGKDSSGFIKEAIKKGEVVESPMYCALKKKDKSNMAVSAIAAPLKNKKEQVIGCVVAFRDITKERAIDKSKSEFVSLASHQLRTPLSAIKWYAEMLLDGDAGKLSAKQQSFLKEIYKGNQRMVDLVNSLLNVSRLELGTFMVSPELLDITQIAKDAVAELASLLKKKKIKIDEKYSDLPKINLDKKLTHIIFQNLLSNAVKYSPDKSNVKISISKDKRNINIEVADKGIGIPKNQHRQVFTKLFRADNVREKDTTGTGLGLYIVKSILDHLGGKIWFESPTFASASAKATADKKATVGKGENKGTTFYVSIPLKGMKKKIATKRLS